MRQQLPTSTFYAVNRGGGAFTLMVNQRGGALVAQAAYQVGIHPTVLTLAGMVLGMITAAPVIAVAEDLPEWDTTNRVTLAIMVWTCWQAAYCLDCGDGQLARIAGKTSRAGGMVDILCDIVVQTGFVCAIAGVAAAYQPNVPAWQVTLFGAVWMLTLVTSQLDKEGEDVSLIASQSLPIRMVKLIRDYGAQITVAALVLAIWPTGMFWLLAAFTAVNGLYLLVLIARTARRSMTSSQ